MTNPVSRPPFPNPQVENNDLRVGSVSPPTFSTLQSIQKESKSISFLDLLLLPITAIWNLFAHLGSIGVSCLQWCFGISRENAAFWQKAKKEFEPIHTDTCLLQSSPNLKSYSQKVRALSADVKEHYKNHIIKAHVRVVYPIKTETEQEAWTKNNFNTFNFDPYFNMTKSNSVVVNAVKSYWEEIQAQLAN